MLEGYMPVLMKTSLFKDISKEQLGLMFSCLKPNVKGYEKNELIAVEGDNFTGIGILIEGKAAVFKESSAGNRVMMSLLEKSDMFGEVIVFSDETKWPATVQASEPCRVVFLSKDKIMGECGHMCTWHRSLIQNMLEIVSQKAMMLNKKLVYLTIKSMRAKLSTFLADQYKKSGSATFTLPMNRNELADFLNVSRPSMSREMCRMRDEGIIDFYLSTIKILNLKLLNSMTE